MGPNGDRGGQNDCRDKRRDQQAADRELNGRRLRFCFAGEGQFELRSPAFDDRQASGGGKPGRCPEDRMDDDDLGEQSDIDCHGENSRRSFFHHGHDEQATEAFQQAPSPRTGAERKPDS